MGLGRGPAAALVLIMTATLNCLAVEHKVGDAAGWTTIANVDYQKWAYGRHFNVDDVLVFEYMNEFHSVLRVTGRDFRSCNTTAPLETHRSGLDKIRLPRPGRFYFICGTPGHCADGQRFHVRVTAPKLP